MPFVRLRRELIPAFFLLCFFQTGCLVRRRVVAPPGKKHETRPLLTTTKEELINRVHRIFDAIESFTMKVDMSPSIGSLYGGQVTDYPTISGYILFMKPADIRVIGLDPVIHATAFDMVSTGNDFRVSIPSKSQFFTGRNDAPTLSSNKFENLRPAAFLTALLIKPPAPDTEVVVAENDTDENKAVYILMIIRQQGGDYHLVRNIYFDRYTLEISRQKTFDENGNITSETRYANWVPRNGIPFPTNIDIKRPMDGYEVVLTVTDMKMNAGDLTATKFVLNQPPGYQLKELK